VNFTIQSKVLPRSTASFAIVMVILGLLASGCANEKYQAKPLDIAQTLAKLRSKDTTSTDFHAYLIKQGYQETNLPFTEWGLNELTLCALYYNSKLDVAKAQLALANATVNSANQQQSPTLGGRVAHSNQANGDKNPWAFGLDVEIPIETGNKRQIRVEEAQHLAQVARIDVADTAWQLRSQIAKDLLRYHENIALQKQFTSDVKKQDALVKLLEKRVQLGALSNTELNTAKLMQQKTLFSLNTEQAKSAEILAALAYDVGLSSEKFKQVTLKPLDLGATLTMQDTLLNAPDTNSLNGKDLQEKALLNRLDIRRSLEKYAAAESKIKLEIAKQTPDISLSPGFAFEFGDSIWSLGFSTLLNLINKNKTLIAEATQLREIEGAQFEVLQAKIIGDLSQSVAAYQASLQNMNQIKLQQTAQAQLTQKLQRQFEAGLIDRLELTQNSLNTNLLEQQLLNAQFNNLNAALAIEDMMQRPLFDDFSMPAEANLGIKHE
jgi:outer membrane protein, heavy metal efflux system